MRVCEGDVVGMAGITKLGKTGKGRRTAGAMILQWSRGVLSRRCGWSGHGKTSADLSLLFGRSAK